MDNEFEGMKVGEGLSLINKMQKNPLWNVTTRTRQNMVNFLEQVMDNCVPGEEVPIKHRLKAVEVMLAAQGQNLVAEKIQIDLLRNEGGFGGREEPKMILLLPPNGSEAEMAVESSGRKD